MANLAATLKKNLPQPLAPLPVSGTGQQLTTGLQGPGVPQITPSVDPAKKPAVGGPTILPPPPGEMVSNLGGQGVPNILPPAPAGGGFTGQGTMAGGGPVPILPPPGSGTTTATGGTSAPLVPFGPGNDLQFQQINPVADPRLQQTQGQVDTAAQGLAQAPSRTQLAQDLFSQLVSSSEPAFQQNLRDITQRNAASGRLGSGMYGSDLTDAATSRQRDLNSLAAGLAYQGGSAQLGDQLNTLGALSGLEGQQYGQGLSGRNELRTERGYQQGVDQTAIDRAVQQRLLEEQLLNSAFGRDQAVTSQMLGLGFGADPTAALQAGSNYFGQQAAGAGSSLSDLLALYAYNNRAGAGG